MWNENIDYISIQKYTIINFIYLFKFDNFYLNNYF